MKVSKQINIVSHFPHDLFEHCITFAFQSDSGKICVSLCHQATFSKLEVIIQEAKHLRGSSSKLSKYIYQ